MDMTMEQIQQIQSAVKSYLDMKYSSSSSSFYYGISCDECDGSVAARDRKRLVRNGAWRTLCWDCMAAGADMHIEPKRSPEEVAKAGGRC